MLPRRPATVVLLIPRQPLQGRLHGGFGVGIPAIAQQERLTRGTARGERIRPGIPARLPRPAGSVAERVETVPGRCDGRRWETSYRPSVRRDVQGWNIGRGGRIDLIRVTSARPVGRRRFRRDIDFRERRGLVRNASPRARRRRDSVTLDFGGAERRSGVGDSDSSAVECRRLGAMAVGSSRLAGSISAEGRFNVGLALVRSSSAVPGASTSATSRIVMVDPPGNCGASNSCMK